MKLLVNSKTNIVVFMSNHIEPHEQGFFVGDVIWPDPDKSLAVFEVADEDCADKKSQQYCYTTKKGFYLNPAFTANTYVDELEKTKSEKNDLEQQLQQVKDELAALKASLELQPDVVSD